MLISAYMPRRGTRVACASSASSCTAAAETCAETIRVHTMRPCIAPARPAARRVPPRLKAERRHGPALSGGLFTTFVLQPACFELCKLACVSN